MIANCFISQCNIVKNSDLERSLEGLTFAVKDSINVEGFISSCGIKSWLENRNIEIVNAVCVDKLLYSGGKLVGKTVMDELGFSILGENESLGTPLNPLAPDRIPGGSSSGSASAVAQKLVDFSIGTDTGGSVRLPAHNCGIFGFRTTHSATSMSGILPLAQSFDTLGVFSNSLSILSHVVSIFTGQNKSSSTQNKSFLIVEDLLELCEPTIKAFFYKEVEKYKIQIDKIKIKDILKNDNYTIQDLKNIFTTLQLAEIWSNHSYLVTYEKPTLGKIIINSLNLASKVERKNMSEAYEIKNILSKKFDSFLSEDKILVFPTAPYFAPKKGSIGFDRNKSTYVQDSLCFTCLSGLTGTPQLSVPVLNKEQLPFGISFLSKRFSDVKLINNIKKFPILKD